MAEILDEIRSDEDAKARALSRMLDVVTAGRGVGVKLREYLEASHGISVDEYVAACDTLRDTWVNTFSPPTPGHIRDAARKFSSKSKSEIREEQDRQRQAHMRRHRMTEQNCIDEIARLRSDAGELCPGGLASATIADPHEQACRKRYGEALERILTVMRQGRKNVQHKRAKSQREEGDLTRAADVYAEVL